MNKAIKVSCDVYFYHIARRVGIDKIAEVCRRFGLGDEVFDLFYEEQPGIVPDKKWKRTALGKKWLIGETLVSAIGQSYFLSTSSQLSLAFAQIVNGGKKIKPELIYRNDEKDIKIPTLLAAQSHLKILMKALDNATNEPGGTSYRSRILGEKKMAGKTGTSQVRVISEKEREEGIIKNRDLPWNKRDHGLFVGYGPSDKPKYAISVIIEHGGSGSKAAAPIASKIFKYLFRKKMDIKQSVIINV
jgi:penicillin-binding protein 2